MPQIHRLKTKNKFRRLFSALGGSLLLAKLIICEI
jgi:hypothetical protein